MSPQCIAYACPRRVRRRRLCNKHWTTLLKPLRERLEYDLSILPGVVRFIRTREEVLPARWRPVKGVVGCSVSSCGQVRRGDGTIAPWDVNSSLYPMVTLMQGDRRLVHIMVAEAFVGPRPKGYLIDHKDDDTMNPSASNLVYVTHSHNQKKRRKAHVTSPAERRAIRAMAGGASVHAVAAKFGVSSRTVRKIAYDILTTKLGTTTKRSHASRTRVVHP